MSFGKFGGIPTVVVFSRKLTCKQEQINCFRYECQRVHRSAPHHWMHNSTRHSVLKVITIGWSHFQSASNKSLKLCLICMCGLLLSVVIWEPTASPASTKWWNSELMLATNFGSLSQTFTKVGSQNFGYQIWFCTRLLNQQSNDYLLNRLFRRRSKKTSKLRVTGLCGEIHRWPVNSPHKGPVTRKITVSIRWRHHPNTRSATRSCRISSVI